MDYCDESNYQYIVVEVDENLLGVSRDELLMALHAENILVRKYFYPGCHNMEPYVSRNRKQNNLGNTEYLAKNVLVFPSGFGITENVIKEIVSTIENISIHCSEVKNYFSQNHH
jgi:dTDP-4-amino-4,6-dideoxygalactose transaminase